MLSRVAVHRLPGASQYFSRRASVWQERYSGDPLQYDLLHVDGRVVAVTSASLHAGEAFELAAWLSGGEAAAVIAAKSVATGPFRLTHLDQPAVWTGVGLPPEQAAHWSAAIRAAHESGLPFVFPGLAEPESYIAALANAVRRTLIGEAGAGTALSEAANEWRSITARIGVARQKSCLRRRGY
jgi:hypothetical protein